MPVIIVFHPFRQFFHYGHRIRQVIHIHVVTLERFHERFSHPITLRTAHWHRTHNKPEWGGESVKLQLPLSVSHSTVCGRQSVFPNRFSTLSVSRSCTLTLFMSPTSWWPRDHSCKDLTPPARLPDSNSGFQSHLNTNAYPALVSRRCRYDSALAFYGQILPATVYPPA